ncbi:MAG: YdcF family protein [Clostridia bacterium]|nr:YdcF family protein [Clostridia bacterium]
MKTLRSIYLILGAACFIYFLVIGGYSRFGLSISWIWPVLGALLIAAGLSTLIKLPPWVRWAWRGLLCLGLAALIALESLVISDMHATAPANLDYLVVLGARVNPEGPSPALTRRLNAVMACLDDHPNAVIIATGGKGPDEPISEAQCIHDELVRRGVDPQRIWVEDQSADTAENIANTKALIDRDDAAIGIITNNYHVWRSLRLAKRAGLVNAHGIAAEYTGPTLFHFMIREACSISVAFLKGRL